MACSVKRCCRRKGVPFDQRNVFDINKYSGNDRRSFLQQRQRHQKKHSALSLTQLLADSVIFNITSDGLVNVPDCRKIGRQADGGLVWLDCERNYEQNIRSKEVLIRASFQTFRLLSPLGLDWIGCMLLDWDSCNVHRITCTEYSFPLWTVKVQCSLPRSTFKIVEWCSVPNWTFKVGWEGTWDQSFPFIFPTLWIRCYVRVLKASVQKVVQKFIPCVSNLGVLVPGPISRY